MDQYADVIQIGARNMQNYSLLKKPPDVSANLSC